MTYPPDPLRGEMVSGFPFPAGDPVITYPPELHAVLGDYPLDYLGLNLFNRRPEQMLEEFRNAQAARHRVVMDWLGKGNQDFTWVVFTDTDKVQHFFWKYMDKAHPGHRAEDEAAFGDAILDLWRRQDMILGEMLAALPEDATVMVLSDHGFDGIYRQINMSTWLVGTDLEEWLKDKAIPPIDVTNGILHYGVQGTVAGASDREAFLDKFIALGKDLKDPETGLCPLESVFRREDIYRGRMMEKAPDIVIQEAPKYYLTRGSLDGKDPEVVENIWTASFSAHHRPDGVLALRGPQVRVRTRGSVRERLAAGGDFDTAHIIDVTPTLLALMEQVVPDAMDGRVLSEALDAEWLAAHPPRVEPVEGFLLERDAPTELSPEEIERLRAVPYIQ
jgi:predicted AlkP superfamily phosphohydrolase/phosphomutase